MTLPRPAHRSPLRSALALAAIVFATLVLAPSAHALPTGVLFFDDFENGMDQWEPLSHNGQPHQQVLSSARAYRGSQSATFTRTWGSGDAFSRPAAVPAGTSALYLHTAYLTRGGGAYVGVQFRNSSGAVIAHYWVLGDGGCCLPADPGALWAYNVTTQPAAELDRWRTYSRRLSVPAGAASVQVMTEDWGGGLINQPLTHPVYLDDIEISTHGTPDMAPQLSPLTDIVTTATSSAGAVVSYSPSATDARDGAVDVTCAPASGSLFAVGSTTVTCSASDMAGNQTSGTFVVSVRYSTSGVLQPINGDGSSVFRLGSTVPVKFRMTDASAGITDASAKLTVAKISDGVAGSELEALSTAAATTGNLFRYDADGDQYVFNLSTKGLEVGSYQLRIDLGDGASTVVRISLR